MILWFYFKLGRPADERFQSKCFSVILSVQAAAIPMSVILSGHMAKTYSFLFLPLHGWYVGTDRSNLLRCALPSMLHAGIFSFLIPVAFTPCLLSQACDGKLAAYGILGSFRLLAYSLPVWKSGCHVAFGRKVPRRSRYTVGNGI